MVDETGEVDCVTIRKKLVAFAAGGLIVAAVLVAVLPKSGCVSAPAPVNAVLTTAPPAVELPFKAGEVTRYKITLGAMHIADMALMLDNTEVDDRTLLEVRYQVDSGTAANRIEQFAYTGRSLIDPRTMLPVSYEKKSVKRDETKTILMTYDHADRTAHYHREKTEDGETDVRDKDLPFESGMDLLSGTMVIRLAHEKLMAEPTKFMMLDERDYLEVYVEYVGPEEVTVPAGTYKAEKFTFKLRELDDTPGEPPGEWRQVSLWVSPDTWLPVQFDAAALVGFGSARAQLVEYVEGDRPIGR